MALSSCIIVRIVCHCLLLSLKLENHCLQLLSMELCNSEPKGCYHSWKCAEFRKTLHTMALGKTYQPFSCYRFCCIWLWPYYYYVPRKGGGKGYEDVKEWVPTPFFSLDFWNYNSIMKIMDFFLHIINNLLFTILPSLWFMLLIISFK